MSVEVNPNYPSDLDSSIPTASDFKAEGDDHIRNVKRVLKATFPNVSAPVTATAAQLNSVAATGGLFSTGTSTTSLTIGAGTQNLTTQAGIGFAIGQLVQITSNAGVANYMTGTCTAYNSTTGAMSVSVAASGVFGSGTFASWSITVIVAPQGVASATVELLTGTAIASAATVNLDTATGNRVHITGTTPITAVTLTRGPRTVIFDGVLTLTHNATTNNLPGAANITTAAGDRATYESDGSIVYCVSYIRAAGAPDNGVTVNTGNGHGSTSTKIRRFTTTQSSAGTAITYADSATLGASFTINEAGLYEIYYLDALSTASGGFGVSLNTATPTTNLISISAAERMAIGFTPAATITNTVTRTVRLAAADVIRPHTNGTMDGATALNSVFSIRKVG